MTVAVHVIDVDEKREAERNHTRQLAESNLKDPNSADSQVLRGYVRGAMR